jgi:sugar-specific transcriptional regulator TrmB
MTNLFNSLRSLGLTENQTHLYLALTKASRAKAGELIKKTGFHRNIVYTTLDELIDLKLITMSRERGVMVYKMLSSGRLLFTLQDKERTAREAIEELSLISKRPSQEVIVYEGIEEFRSHAIHSFEQARKNSMIRYLGTSPHWHTVVDAKTEKELIRIQKRKHLSVRGIAKEPFKEIQSWLRDAEALTEVHFNGLIGSDTNNIEIQEDRIAIQSFTQPYLVVEIINKGVAKNYKRYFDFLWDQSKKR